MRFLSPFLIESKWLDEFTWRKRRFVSHFRSPGCFNSHRKTMLVESKPHSVTSLDWCVIIELWKKSTRKQSGECTRKFIIVYRPNFHILTIITYNLLNAYSSVHNSAFFRTKLPGCRKKIAKHWSIKSFILFLLESRFHRFHVNFFPGNTKKWDHFRSEFTILNRHRSITT